MRRLLFATVALAAVALTADAALAGVRGTLLLRSGDRVSGEIIDMNASGIVVEANGRERAFPLGDVSVIDFEGNASNLPSAEVSQAASRRLFVLRDGRVAEGRLDDIGGTSPLRITFATSAGTEDFTSDQVARIYLAPVPGQTGVTPPTSTSPGTIAVRGDRTWTPTGIRVRRGERVSLRSSGEIRLSESENDTATVNGSVIGRYAPNSPLPRTLAGALIGRIGTGQPFGIGSQATLTMPGDGELFLGVNDDVSSDNSGEFQVEVRGGQPMARPRR
jgi:hypothetical protein